VQREARNVAQRYATFLCVKLCEIATTTRWKLQQAIGDYVMVRAPGWHKKFSEGRTLVEMSGAADDHQQHGQVTTQQWLENLFDPYEDEQSKRLRMKWI